MLFEISQISNSLCRKLLFVLVGISLTWSAHAQREMENLGRGVVAVYNTFPSTTVYVGWRMLGHETNNVGYNVYRNGTKINGSPITGSCNYLDTGGNASSTYRVAAVIGGVEQALSPSVGTWTPAYLGSGQYMGCQEIPLTSRVGYEANDASVGDLDGDGEYEIVLKRLSTDQTHSSTNFHYLEAYEMDGTLMWSINLGPNNLFSPHEINPIVYDFDGDGYAEVALRTCEGTIDGVGTQIGDTDNDGITDYRSTAVLNSSYYMIDGPEFISMYDGRTGKEISRVDYIERDPISQWGLSGMNNAQYGHRADKCMLTPAYLNGTTPSLVVSRGIYHKIILEAWSFRNGTFSNEWTFNTDSWPGYDAQGNHNLTVGDVDGDGFDEIVYGQMTVDHDGTGLYTTTYGHGDAIHMGKMIPGSSGLQIFGVHENAPYGADLRDAATGAILWSHTAGGDTGRGCAAHIDSDDQGYQMWDSGTNGIYDCTTTSQTSTNRPNNGNFLIWWDTDLQREILDGAGSTSPSPIIDKWNSVNNSSSRLISLYNFPSGVGTKCINGTKSNPCISGDLIGDWREEAIYPAADHSKLYIYTTCTMATNRIYTLMHDSMYRTAVAWQCNQYNQPPHPSFYIGAGMTTPPQPNNFYVVPVPIHAPTGLAATAGNHSVSLDWADNIDPDLASYTVYRSTTSGSNYAAVVSGITPSSYTDNDVTNGTTYYYAVTATDTNANESAYSAEASATPGVPVPIVVSATMPGVTVANATGSTFATSAPFNMAGGNAVALLFTGEIGSGDTISATFAGQPMTVGVTTALSFQKSYIFYLINPATTNGQFVISTTGSGGDGAYSAIALKHVGSVAGSNAVANTNALGTIPLIYTTTKQDGFVIDALVNNGFSAGSPAPSYVSGNASQTLLGSTIVDGNCGHLHTYGSVPAAGAHTNVYTAAANSGGSGQRNAYVTLAFDAGSFVNANPPSILASYASNVLTLSWPDHLGWVLQVQTNSLATGLSANWVDVSGSSAVTQTNITVDPAGPAVFYRLKL